MKEEAPDTELISRTVAGDARAFEALVKRYQDFIVSFLFRQTRDRELSLDQAQETFIKAHRSLGSFKGESSFKTWLATIAMNNARTILKKQRRELPTDKIDLPSQTDPESEMQRNQQISKLRSIVHGLKPELREVVQLCAVEGFSYSEAAAVLKVPLGTVCSRMNTALKEVRYLFSKEVNRE